MLKRWTITLDSATLKGRCSQTWVNRIEEEDDAVHVCISLPRVHFGWPSIEGIVSDLKAVPWIISTHVDATPTGPYDHNPYYAGAGELRCAVDLDKLLEYVPNPGPVAEPGSPIIDYEHKEELSPWCNGQSTTTAYITVDQFRDDPEYWGYTATIWMKLVKKYVAKYDAFISHASEDKVPFVRPIADRLVAAGFRIWYDEFELKVGDSLIESIDRGLSASRYAIVVLSEQFFQEGMAKTGTGWFDYLGTSV
jgi:hypothetical protein